MNFKVLIYTLVLFLMSFHLNAQDMQAGFKNLENGEFADAEKFFFEILKEFPSNKTARLCYARAVGLHDDPIKAKKLFSELQEEYKNDLEVQLNYAESLLWNKEYGQAKEYYKELVTQYPDNFGALLGYANTLSNLKEYEGALDAVNKSLQVSPENPNAMTSRKYIRLGYASMNLQQRNYTKALEFFDANLNDFPSDKESLLNKANLYLIIKDDKKAKSVYEELALNLNDSILAFNGISLAAHIGEDEKEALHFAVQALNIAEKSTDSLRVLEAKERYAQALIWNAKYQSASNYIVQLKKTYGETVKILALEATLGMYTGAFKNSIKSYESILAKDSTSFDGNLGIANAYFANSEAKKAKAAALKTLRFFENQQDAEQFLIKLEKGFRPVLEENVSYSFDNGNNEAIAFRTGLKLPLSTKLEVLAGYTYRETMNTNSDLEATSNQINLAVNYLIAPDFKVKVNGGFVKANSVQTDYTNVVGEIATNLKPFVRNDLELGYRRDLQDFNAELLNRQIAGNHIFLNNNYSTTYGLGWYLQFVHTNQSDENARNLLFTSLYFTFLKKLILKGGINYQYIGFKKQFPTFYFSPKKFHATELFLSFASNNANSPFSYELTAAAGYQFIENNEKQSTYRLQGRTGYQISDRFVAGVYGNHSNIASVTAAGFTYTEFGINVKWDILNKPVFKF
ncbi:tetratricopeptide repeat protein [Flavimarina sp. Hel_I_48]|uniref:tetratricopeptide repeat protein n=1 Tax=Flavimarina sp. Hel_I_48 TaxID=1392488 RepID=UPI0004DF9FE3|nr:tetratricopeptide repeat protein [Flavimarina sp. Hel_I_48]